MEYQEEQQQELEVLESIYPDELAVLNGEYPNVQFEVSLKLELDGLSGSVGMLTKEHTIVVGFQLPESYPEEAPLIRISAQEERVGAESDDEEEEEEAETAFDEHGNIVESKLVNLPDQISFESYIPELQVVLEEQIENDMLLGMQMCFALLSTAKDNCETWFYEQSEKLEKEHFRKRQLQEEKEQAKFNGTKVTKESYLAWRTRFRAELGIAERDIKRRLTAHTGKLTGRQMFEQGVDGTTDDALDDIAAQDTAETLEATTI